MPLDEDLIGRLADSQGLVRLPLFESGRGPSDGHDVLLDGFRGSFAISDARVGMTLPDAVSWAWSANVPHHVSLTHADLVAVRWDRPLEERRLPLDAALLRPDELARFLTVDAIESSQSIVAQSLRLFRSIRAVVAEGRGDDGEAVETYLSALDWLADPDQASASASPNDLDLQIDPRRARGFMADPALRSALSAFRTVEVKGVSYKAWSSLSVRHASGPIFQEAHHELVSAPTRDLLGDVAPVAGRVTRGGVHFTPPTLARSLAEQAIRQIDGLEGRRDLSVADFTCGSGAFLVECVRALQRAGFRGSLKVIGRDVSPLAVRMAKYVMRHASADWRGQGAIAVDVRVGDALQDELPSADVVVMNPPFSAWIDIDGAQRSEIRAIVAGVSRPDLSMGFITRALEAVSPRGVLAAIVPARVLEGASNRTWREAIGGRFGIPFVAVFDDLGLFQHATVRIGAVVCTAGRRAVDTLALHAGRDATGEALRALRRDPDWRSSVSDRDGWSVRRIDAQQMRLRSGEFSPLLDVTGPMATVSGPMTVVTGGETPVGLRAIADLFNVYQGIRSGRNGALVLKDADLRRLPEAEQAFFRRTVTGRYISQGRILGHVNVFYPYGPDGPTILDEDTLVRRVPAYYRHHLEPNKTALLGRSRVPHGRWWLLSEWRPELLRRSPLLVSKYFSAPGGFALDEDGSGMVLQGFAWLPLGPLEQPLARPEGGGVPKVAKAYLALLNSSTFFDRLKQVPGMRGGQRDVSQRHLRGFPMPDLSRPHLVGYLTPLAAYADVAYRRVSHDEGVVPSEASVERLVGELLDPGSHVASSGTVSLDFEMPEWMSEIVAARLDERPRAVRSRLLGRLQDLAHEGRLEVIDRVLDHVDPASLHDLALVTLVRGTFPFRAGLRHWVAFRNRVSSAFASRGHVVDDAMYGLY